MVNLITDRTQAHVDLRNRLAKKGWAKMTASEREIWLSGDATKGAYNYTDLNRVESAVAELSEYMGLGLITKTDWNNWDIPMTSDMNRYYGNVKTIINAFPDVGFPELPYNMQNLTYETANNIEIALQLAYEHLTNAVRCGEIYCGEV